MPEGSTAWDVVNSTVAGAGLLAAVANYFWTNVQAGRASDREAFMASVDAPIDNELRRLDELSVDAEHWQRKRSGYDAEQLRDNGIRINRALNTLLVKLIRSEFGGGEVWGSRNTDDFESALEALDESTRTLSATSLAGAIRRLQADLREAVEESRPR